MTTDLQTYFTATRGSEFSNAVIDVLLAEYAAADAQKRTRYGQVPKCSEQTLGLYWPKLHFDLLRICCKHTVYQAVQQIKSLQQIHNKRVHRKSKAYNSIQNCHDVVQLVVRLVVQQVVNRSKWWSLGHCMQANVHAPYRPRPRVRARAVCAAMPTPASWPLDTPLQPDSTSTSAAYDLSKPAINHTPASPALGLYKAQQTIDSVTLRY